MLAPIVIFAYKRPLHLQNLLLSLRDNPESKDSHLVIFIDGAKNNGELANVRETLMVAETFEGFASKTIHSSDRNQGLGVAVRNGLDSIFVDYEAAIVLEDDLVVARHFLKYMNRGLALYHDHSSVASIHGFAFNFANRLNQPYFLVGADCLGWATWRDRWLEIIWNPGELLLGIEKQNRVKEFNLDGAHDYRAALKNQIRHGFQSWAIYWHGTMFLKRKVTLYPGRSLVQYRGADGSGTHAIGNKSFWDTELSVDSSWNFPREINESAIARRELISYHLKFFPKLSLIGRLKRKLYFLYQSHVQSDS